MENETRKYRDYIKINDLMELEEFVKIDFRKMENNFKNLTTEDIKFFYKLYENYDIHHKNYMTYGINVKLIITIKKYLNLVDCEGKKNIDDKINNLMDVVEL